MNAKYFRQKLTEKANSIIQHGGNVDELDTYADEIMPRHSGITFDNVLSMQPTYQKIFSEIRDSLKSRLIPPEFDTLAETLGCDETAIEREHRARKIFNDVSAMQDIIRAMSGESGGYGV